MDRHDPRAPALEPRPATAVPGLLDGLNPPQLEAATHERGPLLILAGPGSGKTRVITRRIAWLITEAGVEPWRILAITFTNKAAREMRERVERLLPLEGAWIGTFHATCARILRREIEVLGGWTRDFTIYDTHDRNQLLKNLIHASSHDPTQFRPGGVGAWISDWKNLRAADAWERDPSRRAPPPPEDGEDGFEERALRALREKYDEALRQANALDFDDLLLKVLEIFEREPGVRDQYARRFRHVMVDEYQDTNRVQYLLARHLASAHGNLAVCGDPDQSIYAWRGADVRNILDFEADYPEAKVVRLEQNYRSTGRILAAAQAVIERNRARAAKTTWTAAGEGEKLVVRQLEDENDEARWIAQQIRGLQLAGRSLSDVAVFYRVNFMQRAIEAALRMAGIPYRVFAGVEFYERREIRDLIAYLKLIVNPSDDVAFARAVNSPSRGIGARTVETLTNFAADRRLSLYQAARSSEIQLSLRGRSHAALTGFVGLVDRLGPLRDAAAVQAIDAVLAEIDYAAWLAEIDDKSGVDREANVDELRAHAEEHDRGETAAEEARRAEATAAGGEAPARATLRTFLQEIALVSDVDARDEGGARATLMTLHSAKGLEFPAVFVAGLEEELLPHSRAVADGDVEEERRLFYVGLTRARERVFLSFARARLHFGQQSWRSPSRFLEEIPEELVEGGLAPKARFAQEHAYDDGDPDEMDLPELEVGDRVEHAHFGRGTVERLSGRGENARATVFFPSHGEKQLMLQYAKLKRIGRAAR